MTVQEEPSLHDRLGGVYNIATVVDDLIDRGVDVDARDDNGGTALHHAAFAGNGHAVRRLLDAGAAPDVVDANGRTPLGVARLAGHHPVVDLLDRGSTGSTTFGRVMWRPFVARVVGGVLVAALVSLGATFGGTLVYDYGFNVETAGDSPVWHKSETDIMPGEHPDS